MHQDATATHDELTELRTQLMNAYERRDFEAILTYVHPEVIVTWQNGARARGKEEVRKFYDEMMNGNNRIVRDVKTQLTVDGLSVLHGDNNAVACGNMTDDFDLMSGSKFQLKSLWTASITKQGDKWLVTSFHVSSNIFDNPILQTATSSLTTVATIAAAVSLAVGCFAGFFFAKRRRKAN